MQVEVKTDYLRKVVSCVSRATANKAIQPILNNILLSCSNGALIVSATDLDIAIKCKIPADIEQDGKVTLPAKKLDEIATKISGIKVNISIDENQHAKIISDKSKFQISGVSSEGFPEIIRESHEKDIFCNSFKQDELLQAISLTSFAASKYEPNSILSGVSFQIDGKFFEIGAADGSRLAKYNGNLIDSSHEIKQSFVIPARALSELERLILNFRENNEMVSFYLTDGQIVFKNNDFSLSTRLLSGTFPSYDKLIPPNQPNKLVFSRTSFLSSIERVSILANERTGVVKLLLEENAKVARFSASSLDYGNANDEVSVEYVGSNLEIAFNYRYLTEVLRNLQIEELLLELDSSLSPLLLKPNKKAELNYTYLIMPVQLR